MSEKRQYRLRLPAVRGALFRRSAAARMVGRQVGAGAVVAAEVIEGGMAARLTIELPDRKAAAELPDDGSEGS